MADAAYGVHIDTNTPQGLRAKQTMDMLNSDWPIGTVGVRTMAAPQQVNGITAAMGNLWGDRPITVSGIEIGAGVATLHVLTPYGAAQDIELRTNDAGMVDRFAVTLQPPVIKKWADIDAELTKSGARYSYQVSKVSQMVQPANAFQLRAPTPICLCRWPRSSNCMCCLRLRMRSRRGR